MKTLPFSRAAGQTLLSSVKEKNAGIYIQRATHPKPSADSLSGLKSLCEGGLLVEALQTVHRLNEEGFHVSTHMFYCILQGCMNKGDLAAGRKAHCLIVKTGFQYNTFLGSHLIRMFALCGSLLEANQVFIKLAKPDHFAWSAIISANAKLGQGEQAVKLYQMMQMSSVKPDGHVFVAVLKACINAELLTHGKMVHTHIIAYGLDSEAFVANTLIDMYAKCGSFNDAWSIFERLSERDLVTWGAMIWGCVEYGYEQQAIQLFQQMQREHWESDRIILICVLKACSSIMALNQGILIHSHIISRGLECEVFVVNTLIDFYTKCGSILDAHRVFDKFPHRDLVTWNAMFSGCALLGHGQDALYLFEEMLQEGITPNHVTLVSILKACSSITALHQGELIHVDIIVSGYDSDLSVGNTLIDMYAKCGSVENAVCLFYRLPKRTVVSWNTIIATHMQHGHVDEALERFWQMLYEGIEPNEFSFISILKLFSSSKDHHRGKLIHCHIRESDFKFDVLVVNALIDMYANCGVLVDALRVFCRSPKRDVVTWNAMIIACAEHKHGQKALELFQQMQQSGLEPNEITFNCILKACSTSLSLLEGKLIHGDILTSGLEFNLFIGNSLIDMYIKCGSLKEARRIFDGLSKQDIVSWNALIGGCVLNGCGQEALDLFHQMQDAGTKPNHLTFVSILQACSSFTALRLGELIHSQIIETGLVCDMLIGSSLVDMYFNCGSLEGACAVFDQLPKRDMVLWCAIVTGCAQHSNIKLALHYFEAMKQEGMKPNNAIFVGLLSAFSHVGLVEEGCFYFKSMREDHGIRPTLDHCNCMVDLLGRVGRLHDAEDFLETTPFDSNMVGWISLLSYCKIHGNVEMAERCFYHVLTMNCEKAAGYVLMSHIYAHIGMQENADKVEVLRKCSSSWKVAGQAFIEANDKVHEFIVGGLSHPQVDTIHGKQMRLKVVMKGEGYMPCLDLVLQPILE